MKVRNNPSETDRPTTPGLKRVITILTVIIAILVLCAILAGSLGLFKVSAEALFELPPGKIEVVEIELIPFKFRIRFSSNGKLTEDNEMCFYLNSCLPYKTTWFLKDLDYYLGNTYTLPPQEKIHPGWNTFTVSIRGKDSRFLYTVTHEFWVSSVYLPLLYR